MSAVSTMKYVLIEEVSADCLKFTRSECLLAATRLEGQFTRPQHCNKSYMYLLGQVCGLETTSFSVSLSV